MTIYNSKKKGFTLIEVLVVVTIIGILAGLGLPQYLKTRERAIGDEAIANLRLIMAAERIYRMEHPLGNTYSYGTCGDAASCSSMLKLDLNGDNFKYSVISTHQNNWPFQALVDSISVTAERQGSGTYSGCKYAISDTSSDTAEPTKTGNCP